MRSGDLVISSPFSSHARDEEQEAWRAIMRSAEKIIGLPLPLLTDGLVSAGCGLVSPFSLSCGQSAGSEDEVS